MKHWHELLSLAEKRQIEHCTAYARHYSESHAMGHGYMMLIAHLVDILQDYDAALISHVRTPVIQQVAWDGDEESGHWRDLMTGVIVDVPQADTNR